MLLLALSASLGDSQIAPGQQSVLIVLPEHFQEVRHFECLQKEIDILINIIEGSIQCSNCTPGEYPFNSCELLLYFFICLSLTL